MTYISWFNKSALYLQEHVMYEHYASDYESVGLEKKFVNHCMTVI